MAERVGYSLDSVLEEKKSTTPALSRTPTEDVPLPKPSLERLETVVQYRLYKRRFSGLFGFVVLAMISALGWSWFGPISNNMVRDFGFTLDQVNWLGNIVAVVYLPVAVATPIIVKRWGLRRCCDLAIVCLVLSAWIRYAGTAPGLSIGGRYALILVGQLFNGLAQPVFQILGPHYSEKWFNLKGRTTATMIIAVANPVGGALGQLISPIPSSSKDSILILGIISTAALPFVFLIGDQPPSPPTYAGSTEQKSLWSLVRAMLGKEDDPLAIMTLRERFDFSVVFLVFGALAGGANAWAVLTAQILGPQGYDDTTSGLMGATLLLAGLVAAIVTAPLFDRVFTNHLALTVKLFAPFLAASWLSLIWAVKPDNSGGIFAVMAVIGALSVTLLPVGLELGVELTRNAEGSSALLWFSTNLCGIIFILGSGALRAGSDASPPLNMRRALIFMASFITAALVAVVLFKGEQRRRKLDVIKEEETHEQTTNV